MMFGLLDMLKQSAKIAVRTSRRANVILPLMATLASAMLHEEIWLVRSTYFNPPNDMTMLRFQSGFWDSSATAEDLFSLRYRFRRADFADMLLRMGLASEVAGAIQFHDLSCYYVRPVRLA